MVRVIGNRSERVRLSDLSDVIYYRQVKEYTDQEFESSRDLQKAVQDGRIAILSREVSARGSIPDGQVAMPAQTGVNAQELRRIIREETTKDSLRDVLPVLADMIRQEISGLNRGPVVQTSTDLSSFVDPSFAPRISTEGMKANINLESREVKTADLSSALDALRKFKNPNP